MCKKIQRKKSKRMSREIIPEVGKIFNLGIKILKADLMKVDMLFYYRDNKVLTVACLAHSNRADRAKAMDRLRLAARKMKADMAIILCDMFTSSDSSGLPPSQAPDRREAIHVYCKTKNDNYGIAQEYERDSMNVIKLGKKIIIEKDELRGLMTDIL